MSLHDSRASYSRYQASSCIQRKPKRTTAPSQLWLKPGRTGTILLVFAHWLRDTDKLMPAGTVRVVLNSKNYKTKSQGAHFLLVLSDVLLILQPQIWLLGDLLSYKFCSIPLTRHGALLNNNKIYLHMNWQSAPWLIVLKQRKTRRNNSNSICSFTCVHLSDELSSRFVSKIEST